MLLGKDVDGRTQLNRMAPTQAVYGAQGPQQPPAQQQMPIGRAKAFGLSGRAAVRETQAFSDAQTKGAAARMEGRGR